MSNAADITEKKKPGGGRVVLFVFLGLILLIILLVVFLVIMTLPGRAQWERLLDPSPTPAGFDAFTHGSPVIEIPQETVSSLLRERIAESWESSEIFPESVMADVVFEDEEIDLLVGTVVRPFRGFILNRRMTVRFVAFLGTTEDGRVVIVPRQIRVGRLPIPIVYMATRRAERYGLSEIDDVLADQGITWDRDEGRILADPGSLFDEFLPGLAIRHVRAIRGYLRIAVRLPESFEASLKTLVSAIGESEEDLRGRLETVLPASEFDAIDAISAVFAAAREISTDPEPPTMATLSYLEGDVAARQPDSREYRPVDFGDALPTDSTVRCGSDSYTEIILPRGHVVKLGENSTVNLRELADDGGSSLALNSGKIRLVVASLDAGKTFDISALDTVMGVRGTDFAVFLSGNRQVDLVVIDGTVGIRPDGDSISEETAVAAGESVVAKKDGIGAVVPTDPARIEEIETFLGVRTSREDVVLAGKSNLVAVTIPHIMEAATVWDRLDEDTQWDVQYAVEGYVNDHPEILRAVDEFFRVNGMESRRGEIESLFE